MEIFLLQPCSQSASQRSSQTSFSRKKIHTHNSNYIDKKNKFCFRYLELFYILKVFVFVVVVLIPFLGKQQQNKYKPKQTKANE